MATVPHSTFLKFRELEPQHQMYFSVISRLSFFEVGGLTPISAYSIDKAVTQLIRNQNISFE